MTATIISLAARRPPEIKNHPPAEPTVNFALVIDDCPIPVAELFIAALRGAGLHLWADHVEQESEVLENG
jgi:hypothetical protein